MKEGDHGDNKNVDKEPMKSSDSIAAKPVGIGDVSEAEAKRTNASDGSLRHHNKHLIAAQEHSIELVDGDKVASRKTGINETHLSVQPQEDWLHILQRVSALPLDQQLKIYGTAFVAGAEQYQTEQRQRALGSLIGTVQGIGDIAVNLATMADFAADIILNNKERAAQKGQQFGDALGQTIVGGVRLFHAADQYLFQIGYDGDYAKPFRDIAALGQALDKKWHELPPQEQERIRAKLITELVGNALLTKGGANAVSESKTFTGILDAVAADSKRLFEASKAAGRPAAESLKNGAKNVSQIIQEVLRGPKPAYAGEAGMIESVTTGEATTARDYVYEARVYTSKLDPRHRLTPVEAAQEQAHLKGERLDKDAWNKLTPKEKEDKLTKAGYEMLENPEPLSPLESESLHTAFRGDKYLFSPVDSEGLAKSFIDAEGNLRPSDLSGLYKGKAVTIQEHIIDDLNAGAKGHSPFTSVGTEGVLYKFGDGKGVAVDVKLLRQAIASGEVKGVQIIEHADLVKYIEQCPDLNSYRREFALRCIKKDGEFLIRGVVPARFIEKWGY